MNRLVQISLVNWYLFARKDIRVDGSVAIVAGNGHGKSSLLDALQVCLLGADRGAISLNARNPLKHQRSRSIQAYMLGLVDDKQKRSTGDSYIVLGFEDSEASEKTSIGLHMTCDDIDDDLDIKWFIIRGSIVGTDNLVATSTTDGKKVQSVRAWAAARDVIAESDCEILDRFSGPSDFRKSYMAILNPDAAHLGFGRVADDRFKRLFKQTIEFSATNAADVNGFIRRFILPESDVSPEDWRQTYATYRATVEKIKRINDEIIAAEAILENTDGYMRYSADYLARNIVNNRIDAFIQRKRLRDAQARSGQIEKDREAAESRKLRLEAEITAGRKEYDDLRASIESSDESAEIRLLEEQISGYERGEKDAKTRIDAFRGCVSSALTQVEAARQKGISVRESTAAAMALAAIDLSGKWTIEATSSPAFNRLQEILRSNLLAEVTRKATQIAVRINHNEAEEKECATQLQLISQGRDPIPGYVRDILAELKSHGITGRVVCTLADVKKEFSAWRRVAETILGEFCYGILVQPENVEAAISVVRHHPVGRGIAIRTNKMTGHAGSPPFDSLAHVIASRDSWVAELILDQLGRIHRVNTDKELANVGNGVTADGMRATGLAVRRLDLVREQRLYGSDPKAYEAEIQRRLRATREELDADRRDIVGYSAITRTFHLLAEGAPKSAKDIQALYDALTTASRTLAIARDRLKDLHAKVDPKLAEQMNETKRDILERESELAETIALLRKLDGETGKTSTERDSFSKNRRRSVETLLAKRAFLVRNRLRTNVYLRADSMAHDIRAKNGGLLKDVSGVGVAAPETVGRTLRRLRERLESFRTNYPKSELPSFDVSLSMEERDLWQSDADICQNTIEVGHYADWMRQHISHMKDDYLLPYRAEAQLQFEKTIETARQTLMLQIGNAISSMRIVIDNLNRNLKKRHFVGNYYQIRYAKVDGYGAFVDLASNIEVNAAVFSPSFIEANPDDPRVVALNMLMERLFDAPADAMSGEVRESALRDIVDYRTYYRFDIAIFDARTDVEKPTQLSARIGSASGGERDIPLYICFGVAMAATYFGRIDSDGSGRGFGIVLLDEAFNTLDPTNKRKVIDFYKGLGLQLILAVPDTDRMIYIEAMDWILTLYRDRDTDKFDLRQLSASDEARSLIADADPIRREARAKRTIDGTSKDAAQ